MDTEPPEPFTPQLAADNDPSQPRQVVALTARDTTSGVVAYRVAVPGAEPFRHEPASATSTLTLPPLPAGTHEITLTAIDAAGNEQTSTLSATVTTFEKPAFTEYPAEMDTGIVPVLRGVTRPSSTVTVFLQRVGNEPVSYEVVADTDGVFTFIPERPLTRGVYQVTAAATDPSGAKSEVSHPIRIKVQPPNVVRIAGYLVDVLSVLVPLAALLILSGLGIAYLIAVLRRFRRRVRVESTEAHEMLSAEFASLRETLAARSSTLAESRKSGRLTKAEEEMVSELDAALRESEQRVAKEIADIEDLSRRRASTQNASESHDQPT